MKNIPRVRCRHAVSLVELTVIMSAASVILSLSASLIHRVMHAEKKARDLLSIERTSLRLANSLRADIHLAASAVTDPVLLTNDSFLRLESTAQEKIEYRREDRTIHRLKLVADRVVAREQFAIPTDFKLDVQAENPRLIVCTLTSPNEANSTGLEDPSRLANSLPVNVQVVAALKRGNQ